MTVYASPAFILACCLALVGCGSSTLTATTTTTVTVATATSAEQQLPYDHEENAFMGSYGWQGGVDISTGCLALIDDQATCDCTYRALRSQGYPGSELAAVGSGVAISNNLPSNAPAWLLRASTVCEVG